MKINKQEMYMEDVSKITSDLVDTAQKLLEPFKTRLSDREVNSLLENELFDAIFNKLEYFCDNDYKNHN